MPKLLKQLSEDPGLVDKYALAFAREGRLKEARMFCFGECWNTDL